MKTYNISLTSLNDVIIETLYAFNGFDGIEFTHNKNIVKNKLESIKLKLKINVNSPDILDNHKDYVFDRIIEVLKKENHIEENCDGLFLKFV